MQQGSNANIFNGLLLIVCTFQACHTATVSNAPPATPQLICYVCDNCAKITTETPFESCNAQFFEKRSTTPQPTTAAKEKSTSPMEAVDTTTEFSQDIDQLAPTNTMSQSPSVIKDIDPITAFVELDVSTINAIVGNTTTTTSITTTATAATTTNSPPQALALTVEDYTYTCYSVHKNLNGVASVERGCSRASGGDNFCSQLKTMNSDTKFSHCLHCPKSRCNSGSALSVSALTLATALLAILLRRQ